MNFQINNSASKKAVLVVEDDKLLCEVFARVLAQEGYYVVCAHSGEEGLREIGRRYFDIVLLDVNLPGINGFEVLKDIRSKHHDVAVVMHTSLFEKSDRKMALQAGADEYVDKFDSMPKLASFLKKVLRRKEICLQS